MFDVWSEMDGEVLYQSCVASLKKLKHTILTPSRFKKSQGVEAMTHEEYFFRPLSAHRRAADDSLSRIGFRSYLSSVDWPDQLPLALTVSQQS